MLKKSIRSISGLVLLALVTVLVSGLSFGGGRAVLALPQDLTVILDAGHGGEDGGAVGISGVLEKDLNLDLTLRLAERLTEAGVRVVLTRDSDRMLYGDGENIPGKRKYFDLKNRLAYAESDPSALFISIHMNSFSDARYAGLQIWCAETEGSRTLAETVAGAVKERLQPDNRRRVKTADGKLFLLSRAPGRAILIECGFLSTPSDCAQLCDPAYQCRLATAIFAAICENIGLRP